MEVLQELKDNWKNKEKLTLILLDVVELQLDLSEKISAEEARLNAAFLSEKEDSYKATDSSARAKAKALVGDNRSRYEYEFQTLTNLINVITLRISQLPA